jgi:NAD(P)-dependent dehydrogenase (short-subunit alcohol dehydrogenase family)
VTCNVVAPGALESRMFGQVAGPVVDRTIRATPLRRLGEPPEIAAAVAYLLSDDAAFLTGQSIGIDGGLSVA